MGSSAVEEPKFKLRIVKEFKLLKSPFSGIFQANFVFRHIIVY